MIQKESPDMIIFRTYDEEAGIDGHLFVQLMFDEDGNLDTHGKLFTVSDEDTYMQLDYDQIVFATETEGGAGSISLGTFTVRETDSLERAVIFDMDYSDLNELVLHLLQDYYNDEKPSLLS